MRRRCRCERRGGAQDDPPHHAASWSDRRRRRRCFGSARRRRRGSSDPDAGPRLRPVLRDLDGRHDQRRSRSASGARYFTLAFLETTGKTSCTLGWDGSKTQPVVANGRYVADIATLRSIGGDVIPSFGGWSADQGGTEIGDSCKDVNQIAAAYEQVVTTYDVTRLDMDIEGKSLTRTDGIDRRNKAIALAPGLGRGERPDRPGPVHAADEPRRARGERPRGAPERGRQRRPGRRREPDGLRLLRPGRRRHGRRPRSAP